MNTYTDLMLTGDERITSRIGVTDRGILVIEGPNRLALFVPPGDAGADWLTRLADEALSLARELRGAEQVAS